MTLATRTAATDRKRAKGELEVGATVPPDAAAAPLVADGVLVRFGEIGIKSPPVRQAMLRRLRDNLLLGMEREKAEGDVFLLYSREAGKFVHAGFVVDVMGGPQPGQKTFECVTIEGNTNEDGSSNGNNTLIMKRPFDLERGDRFIRWVDLDRRAQAA